MKKLVCRLLLFILVGFCFQLFQKDVYALITLRCNPDAWYTHTISFDKSSFPSGVNFTASYPKKVFSGILIYISNTSTTPLYIFREKDIQEYLQKLTDSTHTYDPDLPINRYPTAKIVSNQSYYYSDPQQRLYTSKHLEWILDNSYYEIESTFDIQDNQVFADNRPQNTKPPADQPFAFTVYYGNQPVKITGTLSYQLNNNYDPNAGKRDPSTDCKPPLISFYIKYRPIFIQEAIIILPILFFASIIARIMNRLSRKMFLILAFAMFIIALYLIFSWLGMFSTVQSF